MEIIQDWRILAHFAIGLLVIMLLYPIFEEDADTVAQFVNNLGYALSDPMMTVFGDLFSATRAFYETGGDENERQNRINWGGG